MQPSLTESVDIWRCVMEHSLQTLNAAQRVQLWAERIAECRSSGMSVRAWCRENEISEKTYYYWQRRLYQQLVSTTETVSFAAVPQGIQTGQSSGAAAKISLSGATIEIYPEADAQMIQAILQT